MVYICALVFSLVVLFTFLQEVVYHRTLVQFQPGREQQELFHHTATEVCEDTRKLWYIKSRDDATRGWACTPSVINA